MDIESKIHMNLYEVWEKDKIPNKSEFSNIYNFLMDVNLGNEPKDDPM